MGMPHAGVLSRALYVSPPGHIRRKIPPFLGYVRRLNSYWTGKARGRLKRIAARFPLSGRPDGSLMGDLWTGIRANMFRSRFTCQRT